MSTSSTSSTRIVATGFWSVSQSFFLVSAAQPAPVYLDELYDYDSLQQLINRQQGQLSADGTTIQNTPAQSESWNYDPAGNWNTYSQNNATGAPALATTRTHNAVNEITTLNSSPSRLAYDPAGNMTIIPSDAAGLAAPFTTIWDAWNRLVRVQGGPATIDIRYEYDGQHRRTRQIVTSGTADSLDFYYNSDWKIIEEHEMDFSQNPTAQLHAQYLYGTRDRNDLILRDASISADNASLPIWTRHYLVSDVMLSTTAVVDISGIVLHRFAYAAFGSHIILSSEFISANDSKLHLPILFHGEYFDFDTNFSNYGYRYYSKILGKWLSMDFIRDIGENLYQYVLNSPIIRFDLFGLAVQPPTTPPPTLPPPPPPVEGGFSDCAFFIYIGHGEEGKNGKPPKSNTMDAIDAAKKKSKKLPKCCGIGNFACYDRRQPKDCEIPGFGDYCDGKRDTEDRIGIDALISEGTCYEMVNGKPEPVYAGSISQAFDEMLTQAAASICSGCGKGKCTSITVYFRTVGTLKEKHMLSGCQGGPVLSDGKVIWPPRGRPTLVDVDLGILLKKVLGDSKVYPCS